MTDRLETQPHATRTNDTPAPGWARRLFGYCWRHRGMVILAVTGALFGTGLGAVTPLLSRAALDIATSDHAGGLDVIIAALIVVGLVQFVFGFARRWAGGHLSLDVQHDLRVDILTSVQRLDGRGQDHLHTGQIVSRAASDLQMVQGILAMLPLATGQAVLFVASLALMIYLSPLLTLVALLVIPPIALLTRASRSTLFPATWAASQAAAEVAAIVEEDVTGVRVVKGFGQEDREVGRLRDAARRLYALRLRAVRYAARLTPGMSATTALGQVGVLAFGGMLALHGAISIGTFLAFSMYLSQLVGPTRTLSMLLVVGQQARASAERVLEILDTRPSVTDPARPQPLPDGPLSVALTAVDFGFETDHRVLTDCTVTVPAGGTIAVVGPTGSGKSTIAQLVTRFYDPQSGSVELGGVDVRTARLAEVRSAVGLVFEEAFLFSDTIAANIAYGRPDASAAEITAAARAAQAEEFIDELPAGYDTVIGERGLTLSGGQRQRLALARSLLTDPRVLILDDATSAVDPATESAIHRALRHITAERTTILIAHRRSTLELADTVAVLDGGRIVDVGSHDELLARCPTYVAIVGSGDGDGRSGPHGESATDTDTVPTAGPASGGGVTERLWPAAPATDPTAVPAPPSGRRTGGRGMAGRGLGSHGMSGLMGSGPASPALLARLAALPEATEKPADAAEDGTMTARPARFSLRWALRPVRMLLAASLGLVALTTVAGLALPTLIKYGVDHGVTAAAPTAIWTVSAIALAVVAVNFFLQHAQAVTAGRAGETTLYRLRLREFSHLQHLGLDYYEREMAGRIMTRMTTDVDALSSFLQTGLVTFVVSIATFLGITIVLIVLDGPLTLVAVAALPIVAAATVVFRRVASAAYADSREKVSAVNADLQENVAGMRIVQALGRQQRNARTFADRSAAYRRSRMRAQTAISTYFPGITLLADIVVAIVLGLGAARVGAGTLTAGTLLAFVLYLDSFFSPIQQLSQVFDGYQQALVGLRRIGELLATPTTTPATDDPLPVPTPATDIVIDTVTFRYPTADPSQAALKEVSEHLHAGETVAIVGATGAGKSTLVKLIARYYDVSRGAIRVGGVDIRRFDLGAYRVRLGVVPQEAHLFATSVAANIAYGRPEATDADVEAAARAVGALEAIAALPGGFHHEVAERGRNLSAGQRQLISLARAQLVDPEILLLDEATAALDPAAEAAVLRATDLLARGRTTIIVAHRLATAARADRILVMEHGRLVEAGGHADLMTRGGAYARLYATAG